jgi:hypothetical protein
MAEDDGTESALHKYEEALATHKNATADEIAKARRELEGALKDKDDLSKREIQRLEEKLDDLLKWKEAREKETKDKGKVKDSSSTIVVPPSDTTPQQQAPTSAGPEGADSGGEVSGKRGWRKWI